jgi:hypothetical protein
MAPASIGAHALDTANFLPAGVRDGAWSLPGVKWQKDCIRPVDRRRFLELVGASALTATLRTRSALTEEMTPDYTIRIGTGPQSEYAKKAYDDHVAVLTKLGKIYVSLAESAFKPV